MKGKIGLVVGILLLFGILAAIPLLFSAPEIEERTIITREGIVTDRAMSDALPYLSVAFENGTAVCCWQLHKDSDVPDGISIGDPVRITYGVEKAHGRYALIHVEAVQE